MLSCSSSFSIPSKAVVIIIGCLVWFGWLAHWLNVRSFVRYDTIALTSAFFLFTLKFCATSSFFFILFVLWSAIFFVAFYSRYSSVHMLAVECTVVVFFLCVRLQNSPFFCSSYSFERQLIQFLILGILVRCRRRQSPMCVRQQRTLCYTEYTIYFSLSYFFLFYFFFFPFFLVCYVVLPIILILSFSCVYAVFNPPPAFSVAHFPFPFVHHITTITPSQRCIYPYSHHNILLARCRSITNSNFHSIH